VCDTGSFCFLIFDEGTASKLDLSLFDDTTSFVSLVMKRFFSHEIRSCDNLSTGSLTELTRNLPIIKVCEGCGDALAGAREVRWSALSGSFAFDEIFLFMSIKEQFKVFGTQETVVAWVFRLFEFFSRHIYSVALSRYVSTVKTRKY